MITNTSSITTTRPTLPDIVLAEKALDLAEEASAASTRRVYGLQWRGFVDWCATRGVSPLPAEPAALALYLTQRVEDGVGVSTIDQIISAVAQKHELAGFPKPHAGREAKFVIKGIRKKLGHARRRAAPVGPNALRKMVRALPGESKAAKRDAALFLLGFAGALRRQELVDVDVEHVTFNEDGLELLLPRSKTDQEGYGATIAVPFGSDKLTCPVRALRAWLEVSGIERGAVFRSVSKSGKLGSKRLHGRDVARILQKCALRAGLSVERVSGHSLRSGLGTTAAKQGKRPDVIQKHMRHKRIEQTFEYVRGATAFDEDENAASGIGL